MWVGTAGFCGSTLAPMTKSGCTDFPLLNRHGRRVSRTVENGESVMNETWNGDGEPKFIDRKM